MEKNGALDHLKAEDETIVSEIIALIHEVYNTNEYLKKQQVANARDDQAVQVLPTPQGPRSASCKRFG